MHKKLKWIIILNQFIILILFWKSQFPNHPDFYEISNFIYLQQPDAISCGPTSCAMIVNWHGIKSSIEDCKQKTHTKWFVYKNKEVGMTLPDYIAVCLEKYGIDTELQSGNIHKLKKYVSENKPVIVLLRSGIQYWHYVVVIGYDQNNIIIADPGYGKRELIPEKIFTDSWKFKADMRGNQIPSGFDFYGYIVRTIGEVSEKTMIVPKA